MNFLLAERPGPNLVPYAVAAAAIGVVLVARRLREPGPRILLPLATFLLFVCAWQIAATRASKISTSRTRRA